MEMSALIHIVYVLSAITFLLGFKLMGNPESAQRGNLISGAGMAAAVLVTLMDIHVARFDYILFGLLAGTAGGLWLVKNTDSALPLPAVALLNGAGGLAALLVAFAQFYAHPEGQGFAGGLAMCATAVAGMVAFAGSLTVWAGMTERLVSDKFMVVRKWRYVYLILSVLILLAGILFASDPVAPEAYRYFFIFTLLALALGAALALPDSHKNFPAAISLFNTYSGAAACAAGFILQNPLMIIAGALTGAGSIALRNQLR
jgi:NAD(P) transhydrogenase subunit beta